MCSVVPCPTTLCPPRSAFCSLVVLAFWGRHRRTVSWSAPTGSLGFAIRSQARQDTRPNRLSLVRNDRLASRCSPPRLTTKQLRSAFNQSSVWLRVFSPPLQVRSRAHERWPLRPPALCLVGGARASARARLRQGPTLGGDPAKGRWPKRPPLHKHGFGD